MLRVGLTGGIGAGKSTVAARLSELGATVLDADQLARRVLEPGSAGLAEVVAAFGTGVLQPDRRLDRSALATAVFGDRQALARLNAIVHPRVARMTEELAAAADPRAILVHDVPLLVENGLAAGYHLVVVVGAPEHERVRRLVATRGMSADDATARVRAQADDTRRRAVADVWLDNSGDAALLLAAVDRLHRFRLLPFERNLNAGRPAPQPDRAVVSRPDPTWPEQAARQLARIARAVSGRALGLWHVGSTAVPGLPARDVLDLQLVTGEEVAGPELTAALAEAGLAPVPGRWWDEEPGPAGGLVQVPTLRFGTADPGRPVDLHVRPAGWTARHQVLFRDWLRAHPEHAAEYHQLKLAWAGRTVAEYTTGKGPWVREAYRLADAWALERGWTVEPGWSPAARRSG